MVKALLLMPIRMSTRATFIATKKTNTVKLEEQMAVGTRAIGLWTLKRARVKRILLMGVNTQVSTARG
jgi:uncharacterized protein involved in propanediol utilization